MSEQTTVLLEDGSAINLTAPWAPRRARTPSPGFRMSLEFADLRAANLLRLPQFRNRHGELAHSMPDGSDWTPAQWLQAVVGELGEYANVRKKFERGDLTLEDFAEQAAKELADVQVYLDILALRCLDRGDRAHAEGIDLGMATISKFNEVSDRVGAPVWLSVDGVHVDE